jgi:GNAT superfamily N-acetyltransferase
MTFQIRHLSPADYPLVISVIDQWWGGRPGGRQASAAIFRALHRHQFRGRTRRQAGWFPGRVHLPVPADEAYIHFVGVAPAERGSGLGRLLYEAFFRAAEARGCILIRAVTSPVNRGSVAFHQRMGFQLEPGDTEAGGIPVSSGYDGPGNDRVRFLRILRGP